LIAAEAVTRRKIMSSPSKHHSRANDRAGQPAGTSAWSAA
jgi:hypothetical protein